jgi:hypothetical protein
MTAAETAPASEASACALRTSARAWSPACGGTLHDAVRACLEEALAALAPAVRAQATIVLIAAEHAQRIVADYVEAFERQRGRVRPSQSTDLEITKLIGGIGAPAWGGDFFALANDGAAPLAASLVVARIAAGRAPAGVVLEVTGNRESARVWASAVAPSDRLADPSRDAPAPALGGGPASYTALLARLSLTAP